MRERIEEALKRHTADYVEIRIEETTSTGITYRGKELEEVGTTTQLGGSVRAAVNGGWGFVSFNKHCRLAGQGFSSGQSGPSCRQRKDRTRGMSRPCRTWCRLPCNAIRGEVTLAEKKRLMDSYVEEIWRTPKIQTSTVGYGDGYRKQYYGNSTGTYIEQERGRVFARFGVVARDNGNVQQVPGGFCQQRGL